MIGSGDDVDRSAPNPNRVTQPFDRIGKGEGMSELDAKGRYYWSKIRQALKDGDLYRARLFIDESDCGGSLDGGLGTVLHQRVAATFTAGCIALGDPAPLDKEQDHE